MKGSEKLKLALYYTACLWINGFCVWYLWNLGTHNIWFEGTMLVAMFLTALNLKWLIPVSEFVGKKWDSLIAYIISQADKHL